VQIVKYQIDRFKMLSAFGCQLSAIADEHLAISALGLALVRAAAESDG
jgi:hypothetical protein